MIEIGIVICNYNKKEYLEQCINSVLNSDLKPNSYEIIVVDNASEDGAPDMVRDLFSDKVTLIENSENIGGSGGFATGIEYYLQKKYPYLMLLDNDAKVEPDAISLLKNYLDSNPKVGIVGSKLCTMDQPDTLQELGSFINYETYNVETPLKGSKDTDELPAVVACDYVPACSLLSKYEVVKKIGAFDREHFIYWDDMDWCLRAKEAGYEVHAINASKAYHKMGVTNTQNTFGNYYFKRNRILFFLKHLNSNQIQDFCDKITEEVIKLTFFSHVKKRYNSAIVELYALDDLSLEFLGKQPHSSLPKEQHEQLEDFEEFKESPIALYLSGVVEHDNRIFNELSHFFTHKVDIIDRQTSYDAKIQFPESKVIKAYEAEEYSHIFYAVEHIIQPNIDFNSIENNAILIDQYFNSASKSKIDGFIDSYNTYNSIFNTIFKPVLLRRFELIYKRLNEKKTLHICHY